MGALTAGATAGREPQAQRAGERVGWSEVVAACRTGVSDVSGARKRQQPVPSTGRRARLQRRCAKPRAHGQRQQLTRANRRSGSEAPARPAGTETLHGPLLKPPPNVLPTVPATLWWLVARPSRHYIWGLWPPQGTSASVRISLSPVCHPQAGAHLCQRAQSCTARAPGVHRPCTAHAPLAGRSCTSHPQPARRAGVRGATLLAR